MLGMTLMGAKVRVPIVTAGSTMGRLADDEATVIGGSAGSLT